MSDDELMVTIAMKEYDTLRTEALARIRSRFELLAVGVAGSGLVFGAKGWVPGALAATAVVSLYVYLGWSIGKISNRVAAIERDVNRRLGEDVLQWESRHASRFYIWLRKSRATTSTSASGLPARPSPPI